MRKLLWGAAAVLAITAPSVAHADTTGVVGLRINHNLSVMVDNFSAK